MNPTSLKLGKSLVLVSVPAVALALYVGTSQRAGAAAAKAEAAPRFFEMRKYTTTPGKMPALKTRFREHTTKYFVKHGMQTVGFWQAVSGDNAENTLVYLLAYPSKEAREASWKAFSADPDWKKAFTDSEKDGKLVDKVESTFLQPTDFSSLK